jgi:hypothetical protein
VWVTVVGESRDVVVVKGVVAASMVVDVGKYSADAS